MKKRNFKISITALSVATALGLSGCLGGSDDAPLDTSVPTPKVTQGIITGFGSVFVNGVEYETNAAAITTDGLSSDELGLKLGMVVQLKGEVNADGTTGNALSIDFADNLEGPLGANNIALDSTLVIMGQTITVTADTIFESGVAGQLSPADIAVGNIVEVSGFTNGDGNIFATRLEVKKEALGTSDEIELKGLISALDPVGLTFTLGGMTVDYSAAAEIPATMADGLYVEAKTNSAPAGNTFVASKIEVEGDGDLETNLNEGEDLELMGLVTSVGAVSLDGLSADFTLNGQTVRLTVEEQGKMAEEYAKLTVGAKVRVEGEADANGLLIVKEIDQGMGDSDLEFKGYVDSVDVANKSVTILGQAIYLNNYTVVYDGLDVGAQRYFGVDDLVAGNWIEVKVAIDATTGQFIAIKLERDDDPVNQPESLEGKIIDISTPGHMLIGDSALPLTQALDVDVSGVNAASFMVDDKVVIELNGGVLSASTITLD